MTKLGRREEESEKGVCACDEQMEGDNLTTKGVHYEEGTTVEAVPA